MEQQTSVIIDAGHGGAEPGAMFEGRKEKDDTLRLAVAVGEILENNGIRVMYTRTTDVYDTPLEKAMIANGSGAEFFRIHSPECHACSGNRKGSIEPGIRKYRSGSIDGRKYPEKSCESWI